MKAVTFWDVFRRLWDRQESGNLRTMFIIVENYFFECCTLGKKIFCGECLYFKYQSEVLLFTFFFFRIISVELPDDARQFGIQFRWWQPYHSSQGEDVWAIDEIIMTSVLFNSISLDFTNLVEVTQSLGFYLGNVQPYCSHDWTLW